MRRLFAALLFVCLLVGPLTAVSAHAELLTLTASHTYVMGEADTRQSARASALREAKRKLLEQAGVRVESLTAIRNFAVSSDLVRSYAGAVLRIRNTTETTSVTGGNHALTVTLTASVDTEELAREIERLQASSGSLSPWAAMDAPPSTPRSPSTSNAATNGPSRVSPDAWRPAGTLATASPAPSARPSTLTPEALRATALTLSLGLTGPVVQAALGAPHAATTTATHRCETYPGLTTVYRQDRLACIRTRLDNGCSCAGFGHTFVMR